MAINQRDGTFLRSSWFDTVCTYMENVVNQKAKWRTSQKRDVGEEGTGRGRVPAVNGNRSSIAGMKPWHHIRFCFSAKRASPAFQTSPAATPLSAGSPPTAVVQKPSPFDVRGWLINEETR
jgi:hypothetical protein